ncbi:MAG: ribonuclease E, partial [Planctomycetes bacterium]|nr:ribonuclease E [Planctomycetota bacterium]
KGGGSIVIEQTEALVAIDVNSGKYRKQHTAEQTALQTNIEAAKEIARQLRLRDMGGLIICDFIDMQDGKNRREVEKAFRTELKNDRARSRILRISAFGIIEMTRQRMRPSLQSSTYLKCSYCGGSGMVKSLESVSIEIIRLLSLVVTKKNIKRIELTVSDKVADFLQNEKRSAIARMELENDKRIVIISDTSYPVEQNNIVCFDDRESVVKF